MIKSTGNTDSICELPRSTCRFLVVPVDSLWLRWAGAEEFDQFNVRLEGHLTSPHPASTARRRESERARSDYGPGTLEY